MSRDPNAEPEFVFVNDGVDKFLFRAVSGYESRISVMGPLLDDFIPQVNSIVHNIFESDTVPAPDNGSQGWLALAEPALGSLHHNSAVIGDQTHKAPTSNRPDPPFSLETG